MPCVNVPFHHVDRDSFPLSEAEEEIGLRKVEQTVRPEGFHQKWAAVLIYITLIHFQWPFLAILPHFNRRNSLILISQKTLGVGEDRKSSSENGFSNWVDGRW